VTLPRLGQALSLWMQTGVRTDEFDRILDTAEIRRFVRWGDGTPIDAALARSVRQDPESWRAYRKARNAELVAATDGHTVLARCPGCRAWEAELSPLALAVALRAPYWPVVDERDRLAIPALALGRVHRGLREIAPAATLTVRLPGSPEGQLAFADDAARDLEGWLRASGELFRSPARTQDWTADSPGWTALLHLASLVPGLTGHQDPSADALLELAEMPLAAFLALDQVYALTQVVEVPEGNSAMLNCPRCGARFGALSPSVQWPETG
jgi:uncharacterized C2H2 Zn-finger protein